MNKQSARKVNTMYNYNYVGAIATTTKIKNTMYNCLNLCTVFTGNLQIDYLQCETNNKS